ncbi:MAG: peroxiredoxin-like family protein [Proteobacteria bacterium]|nr:peroxiredoxin-like family protein [Pseudomonadota bacterium]
MTAKLKSGDQFPEMRLPKAGGGEVALGGTRDKWQMVVVYRGKHCPICSRYLAKLGGMADRFAATNTELVAISADTAEQAEASKAEWDTGAVPLAYGLDMAQMRALGLYITEPRGDSETTHAFPEPGLFVLNPEGRAHMIDIANAPFIRPDLEQILGGIGFVQEKNYPIRGTAE